MMDTHMDKMVVDKKIHRERKHLVVVWVDMVMEKLEVPYWGIGLDTFPVEKCWAADVENSVQTEVARNFDDQTVSVAGCANDLP